MILCLSLASCAKHVGFYYPPSIRHKSRSELVRLESKVYPYIVAIDGQPIASYMSPMLILPGPHKIKLKPEFRTIEAAPYTIDLDGQPGDIYRLNYIGNTIKQGEIAGSWAATTDLVGTSPPPPHPLIMKEKGLVYLYRTDSAFDTGSAKLLRAYLNGKQVQYLFPGYLCPLLLSPGPQVLKVTDSKLKVIDIKAGEVYYLRASFSMGWSGGTILESVDPKKGASEISKTEPNVLCDEVPRGYYPLNVKEKMGGAEKKQEEKKEEKK